MNVSADGPTERVAVGGVANVLGFAATTAIALLLTPYLLRRLGASAFGVWALVGVVVTSLQLADLGLPRALSRAVAAARAQRDDAALCASLSATLALYLLVGTVGALALMAGRELLVAYGLAVPAPWQAEARAALFWVSLCLFPALGIAALGATLDGLQRMEWTSLALVTGRTVFALGAVVAATSGGGVRGLALALLLSQTCQMAVAALGLRSVYPAVRLRRPAWTVARPLLVYAFPIFASALLSLTYIPWSKLVLARTAPVAMVGYYEVISTFATQVFLLAWVLAMAAFPATTQAWTRGERERVRWLYARAWRWGAMVALPASAGLMVIADPLLRAWLGVRVPQVTHALYLVTLGWTANALAAPSAVTLQAVGRPGHTFRAVLANGVVNACLSLILAPPLGFIGVALANLVSSVTSSALMTWLCWRALALQPSAWRTSSPAASSLARTLLGPLCLLALFSALISRSPAPSLWPVVLAAGGYALLYALVVLAWGPLSGEERDRLRGLFRQALQAAALFRPSFSSPAEEIAPPMFPRQSPDEDAPDLSIIIVNWNVREHLRACLASIFREAAAEGALRLEVIVIDNASAESPAEMLESEFPGAQLIAQRENVGFARACNLGLLQAKGRHLLLLNPDTEVRSGALTRLIACLEAHPRAGAIGPLLRQPSGDVDHLGGRRFPTPWSQALDWAGITRRWPRLAPHLMPTWDHRTSRAVECLSGAALLLRREALAEVGLLDPAYFLYAEDVDLCFRLAQAGWERWYCAEAEIVHWGGQSSAQIRAEATLLMQRGIERFFRKHYGLGAVLLNRALILLIAGAKALLFAGAGLADPVADRRQRRWREARAHVLLARWALAG